MWSLYSSWDQPFSQGDLGNSAENQDADIEFDCLVLKIDFLYITVPCYTMRYVMPHPDIAISQ